MVLCVLHVTERCDIYVKGGNIDYVTQASHFRNTTLQDKITSCNLYADHAKKTTGLSQSRSLYQR